MRSFTPGFPFIFVVFAGCGSELDLGAHDGVPPGSCMSGPACGDASASDGAASSSNDSSAEETGTSITPAAGLSPAGIFPAGPWVEAASGIEGGDLRAISFDSFDPKVVYAASHGAGIFRSLDGGDTWKPASSGLGDRICVESVVAHPGQADTVFAWAGACKQTYQTNTDSTVFFRSTDRGTSWSPIALDQYFSISKLIAPSPSSPNVVYIASSDGFSRSTDGGVTFAPRTYPGNPSSNPTSLVIDPKHSDVVYCIVDEKIWKSVDGGSSWASLPITRSAFALIVSGADSQRLVANVNPTFVEKASIARSDDGGQSWTLVSGTVGAGRLVESPSVPSRLYNSDGQYEIRRFFATNDGGKTFAAQSAQLEPRLRGRVVGEVALAVDPLDSQHVVFSSGAVLSTPDGGASLVEAKGGIMNRDVVALVVAPSSPNVLYAGSRSDLYKTTNGGVSWTRSPQTLALDQRVTALAVHPTNPDVVYAAMVKNTPQSEHTLWKSIDAGQTFHTVGTSVAGLVQHLLVDPMVPSTVLAFVGGGNSPSSVRVSRDDGVSWSAAVLPSSATAHVSNWSTVSFDPKDSSRLIATLDDGSSSSSAAVVRSTDRGATFSVMTAGTKIDEHDLFAYGRMRGVLYDRKKEGLLYACMSEGLYRSTDGGASWNLAMVGTPAGEGCTRIFVTEGEGHVGMLNRVLRVSVDSATSWQTAKSLRASGEFYDEVKAIAVDPSNPKTVFLGLSGSVGVARTTSFGL